MGKLYAEIDENLKAFIAAQEVFFVATAPSGPEGHMNLSPKGLDAFRVLGPRSIAYLDLVGSGAETLAHLRENGRIVIMLCAFSGAPRIVRLHGTGCALEPPDPGFSELLALFPPLPGTRSIVSVKLDRISDSCGTGVPLYRFEGQRKQLPEWAVRKGDRGLLQYQKDHNIESIDGLRALRWVEKDATE